MAKKINRKKSTGITKEQYSYLIGLWKSVKNTAVVLVLPGIIYALSNYTEWISPELAANPIVITILGGIGYFLKNMYEMKNK
jgi:hypothetical protein